MTRTNKDNNTARFIARTLGIAILVFIVSYAACMLTPVNTSYDHLPAYQQQAVAANYAKAFGWKDAPEIDHAVAVGYEGEGLIKCLNNCHIESKTMKDDTIVNYIVADDADKNMKVAIVPADGYDTEDVFTVNESLDITATGVLTIDKDSNYSTISIVFAR